MSTLKKVIIIIISIILMLFMICFFMLWNFKGYLVFIGLNKFLIAPSYSKTNKFFENNINELTYVTSELLEMEYDKIKMEKEINNEDDRNYMEVKYNDSTYETIPVPENLIVQVEKLYENGVLKISCGEGYVSFLIWSIMDESRGIIYSDTGEKPDSEQLIEVKQLSNDNWFYYVHNYEKAKERNPERFK